MSEHTFGYQPAPLPSSLAQYDDYAVGQSTIDYRPTPWDDFSQVNIETMWTWIQNESDEKTRAVAEMWRRIGLLLEATRHNLERYAGSLQQAWQSPAASEFLRRVGAALYSLDEWHQSAVTNASTLNTIADKISSTQGQMRDVWQRYTTAAADAERRREEEKNDGVFMSLVRGFTEDPPTHDEVRREFTSLAKPVMKALADTYTDSALSLQRGSIFKGPTAAADSVFSGEPGSSAGSAGGYGRGGGPGTAAPAMPGSPSPSGVPLPELAGLPMPPSGGLPLPGTPLPAPAPVPPGGPSLIPGMPMPPAPGPRPPATQNPPPRPGTRLPARPGESPVRTPPVSRPNLPGASPRTGVPGTPGTSPTPSTPRHPNLLGTSARNATSVPPRVPLPGVPIEARTTAAPRLDGRHGSRSGSTPGLGRPGLSGGPGSSGTSPNLAGRRKPDPSGTPTARPTGRRARGQGSQVLGGRTAPVSDTAAGRPHGPQLGDRNAERTLGAARPAKRDRRRDDEPAKRSGAASDEDLWTVDGAHSAVEAPAPRPSTEPPAARRRAE